MMASMWPFARKAAQEPFKWAPVERCWRSYELPEGRTWESFRYLVEEGYGDDDERLVTDALVTDDPAHRDRMAESMANQGYDAHVTDRETGEITVTKAR